MRTITFRTMPGITACVIADDKSLLVLGVTAREGAVPLDDGGFRLPAGTDPVDGKDAIGEIGAAIGNRLPRIITAAAEWNDADGVWDLLLVDDIVDPRAVKVADILFDDACDLKLRVLDIEDDSLEASITLTIPIEGMGAQSADAAIAAQAERIDPLDDLDDADWKVSVLDHDEGPKVAWWIVMVKAKTPQAVAELDAALARRTPWQRGARA